VPHAEEVAAFLANEPVLAVPVNVVGQVEEPLRASEGSIPSMLDHPLGSNIQHILEDFEMGSEESVGMADDNLGPSTAAAVQTPPKTFVHHSGDKGLFLSSDPEKASEFDSRNG
jgi:hypothetical protein